jgi:hypothetical protein
MIVFLETSFQIFDEILKTNFIDLRYILKSAEPLQETADTISAMPSKDPQGLRPGLQNLFNSLLRVENLCVHLPQRYTEVKYSSLRLRK